MKIVSTNAVGSSMKLVKSGGEAADAGSNRNYSGWAATDTMARMIKGLPAGTYDVPVRLFDKSNIDSVELNDTAAGTGEWFGPLDYQQDFQKLWGLA
jgi:ABC-type sugar transport system substrate-binding protein